MEKIHTVSKSLKPACGKWKSFAAGIGIQAGTIEKIEEKFHDPGRCLNVVINNWFNGTDAADQKYKKLTWRSIINVLQSPIVNECTLADKIMSTQGWNYMYIFFYHLSASLLYTKLEQIFLIIIIIFCFL